VPKRAGLVHEVAMTETTHNFLVFGLFSTGAALIWLAL